MVVKNQQTVPLNEPSNQQDLLQQIETKPPDGTSVPQAFKQETEKTFTPSEQLLRKTIQGNTWVVPSYLYVKYPGNVLGAKPGLSFRIPREGITHKKSIRDILQELASYKKLKIFATTKHSQRKSED